MDKQKLIKQLFIGKVSDALGVEMTFILLKESIDIVNSIQTEEKETVKREETSSKELIIEIEKNILIKLYNFAYDQAIKTGEVEKLHNIDEMINRAIKQG